MRAENEVRKGVNERKPTQAASPSTATSTESLTTQQLRIAEIYASRQGEGRWTGKPSVFLRASGCNLRCWFCDTPFASWHPEGDVMSVDAIIQRVLDFSEPDVVITGGEPLLFPAIVPITQQLAQAGRTITIETAGTVEPGQTSNVTPGSPPEFACHLLSISPKLSSSAPGIHEHPTWHRNHNERRHRPDLVERLTRHYDYQLKFVVSDLKDASEVLEYLALLPTADADRVWIMPEGTNITMLDERAEWLQPWCQSHGFHFCQRQHIYWYGNRRGT